MRFINAQTDTDIDPALISVEGNQFTLNNSTGEMRHLTLMAETADNVGSVSFYLTYDIELAFEVDEYSRATGTSKIISSAQPFMLTNYTIEDGVNYDFTPWRFLEQGYELHLVPHSEPRGAGVDGDTYSISLSIVNSKIEVEQPYIDFFGSPADQVDLNANLEIVNTGTLDGNIEFLSAAGTPLWLQVPQFPIVVPPGGKASIEISAAPCTKLGTSETTLSLSSGQKVFVRRACGDTSLGDFSLDRFYFNQGLPAMDSLADEDNVPLLTNRGGIARLFARNIYFDSESLPQARLYFKTADSGKGVYDFQPPQTLSDKHNEGELASTYNIELPPEFFELGTEFYVVLDPFNQIQEIDESNNRYPKEGYLPLDIIQAPKLDIVFVPIMVSGEGAEGVVPELDPQTVEDLLRRSLTLLPLGEIDFEIREQPLTYSGTNWAEALMQIEELRNIEGSSKYYHGLINEPIGDSRTAGIAYLGGQAALSLMEQDTIAHELGHNLSLQHIRCNGEDNIDESYRNPAGAIGVWGYDVESKTLKDPRYKDIMTYCNPQWISPYSFNKVIDYRSEINLVSDLLKSMPQRVVSVSGIFESEEKLIVVDNSLTYITRESYDYKSISSEFLIELKDPQGESIISTGLKVVPIEHSEHISFHADIPLSNFNTGSASEIVIYKSGNAIFKKALATPGQYLLKKSSSRATATRASGGRVKVDWVPFDNATAVIVDPDSGKILAFDKSGSAIIYTNHDRLQLKYNSFGQSRSELITIK